MKDCPSEYAMIHEEEETGIRVLFTCVSKALNNIIERAV
jgi:hypothetical protein